ncbi:MAG UNVERIFIED_CONTAM: site-specific DNA-methyltransferase [Microcystis novacekii LVE1205-3]
MIKAFIFLNITPKVANRPTYGTYFPKILSDGKLILAPYPVGSCILPLLATCPEGGTVLDPFCGTGTTLVAARNLGRRSVGIDISRRYLELTKKRCESLS